MKHSSRELKYYHERYLHDFLHLKILLLVMICAILRKPIENIIIEVVAYLSKSAKKAFENINDENLQIKIVKIFGKSHTRRLLWKNFNRKEQSTQR